MGVRSGMSKFHPLWPTDVTAGLIATDRLIAGDSEEEERGGGGGGGGGRRQEARRGRGQRTQGRTERLLGVPLHQLNKAALRSRLPVPACHVTSRFGCGCTVLFDDCCLGMSGFEKSFESCCGFSRSAKPRLLSRRQRLLILRESRVDYGYQHISRIRVVPELL